MKNEELFETYYNYINWIEQIYPSGNKEVNFSKILEDCIQTFYRDKYYRNNEKMLSIFLKYTNIVTDPLSVFEFFYKVGFAKKLSKFYIDWSFYLEMQNNYKKALQIIKMGIKNEAEPIGDLNRTLNYLEIRTMRFVISNPEECTRKGLTNLKTISKHGNIIAPINRTSTNFTTGLKNIINKNANETNTTFQIFVENGEDAQIEFDILNSKNFKPDLKENEIKLEKWCGNKLNLKTLSSNNSEKFEIYDESNENSKPIIGKKISVAIFEDESKLKHYVWYDKIKEIYRNNTEYSFEEIRYDKWLQEQSNKQKKFDDSIETNTKEHDTTKRFIEDTKNESQLIRTCCFNGTIHQSRLDFDRSNTINDTTINEENNFQIMKDGQTCHNFNVLQTNDFKPDLFSTAVMQHSIINKGRLSPIIETSREDCSKSSSSSSGTSSSAGLTSKISFNTFENIDPFNAEYRKIILSTIFETIELRKGYQKVDTNMDQFGFLTRFNMNKHLYVITSEIFKSDLQEIYSFVKVANDDDLDLDFQSLKIYHKLDYWEFYIYDELEKRLIYNNCLPDVVSKIFINLILNCINNY